MTIQAPEQGLTSLDRLVQEADRQLTICNACRYCEGFCAVFPALERRTLLGTGDIVQLANLCHDCRACFDACMYTAPHVFDVNPPAVLSAARLRSYDRYVWPRRVPRLFRGWLGVTAGMVIAAAITVLAACLASGPGALVRGPASAFSPYDVIPYGPLLALAVLPAIYGMLIFYLAGRSYWHDIGGRPAGSPRLRPFAAAVGHALTLRNQRGGGADCYYPEDTEPSPTRRRLHIATVVGFGLCFLSTLSAAFSQDILGIEPPYPILSVPVISGTIGGIGMVVGCVGLLHLKRHSSKVTSFAEMTIKDYGLLSALLFLALTGLASLVVRDTAAYPLVLVVHLSAVMLCLATAPYSKFVHVIFRFQALVRDEMEVRNQEKSLS